VASVPDDERHAWTCNIFANDPGPCSCGYEAERQELCSDLFARVAALDAAARAVLENAVLVVDGRVVFCLGCGMAEEYFAQTGAHDEGCSVGALAALLGEDGPDQ
jgi:hypothetical protein